MAKGQITRTKTTWVFNAGASFSGSPKWLFLYMRTHHPEISCYWLCDTEDLAKRIRRFGYKAVTYSSKKGKRIQQQAGVYVVNQAKERIPAELRGAVMLNLWHGVGIKGVERSIKDGFLLERVARKYIRNNQYYRDNQLFLVTSPMMEDHFVDQVSLSPRQIIRGSYPQNIYPRLYGEVETYDHDIRASRGLSQDTRVAVYCPTPRQNKSSDVISRALPDVPELIKTLNDENMLLILKMHPELENNPGYTYLKRHYSKEPRLLFWDPQNDIYEIFSQIDVAIVDYTSMLYDFIASGVKSYIRYIFDYEDGNVVADSGLDYLTMSVGTIASDFSELLSALKTDTTVDESELARMKDLFWAYSDDNTLEKLVQAALDFRPVPTPLKTLHSFDIFDTIIERRSVTPISVFRFIQQKMASSYQDFPLHLQSQFIDIRRKCEAAAREEVRKTPERIAKRALEITFADIYARMKLAYNLNDAQVSSLMHWEVEGEFDSCILNNEIVNQIKTLLIQGDPVILISDMYLPTETVRRLLYELDPILGSLPLFVSSETGERKVEGTLFLRAFSEVGYDYKRWIHHGDNPVTDVKAPRRLGIVAAPVKNNLKLNAFETEMATRIPTYDGALLAGMFRELRMTGSRDMRDVFAIQQVSMYLVPYVNWILRDAIDRGYKTLYFMARDGHHMQRIANTIIEANNLPIATKYFFGSRKSLRLPSQIDSVDEDQFEIHGDFNNCPDLKSLLDVAEMDRGTFNAMFPAFSDLSLTHILSKQEKTALLAELRSSTQFRNHILERAELARPIVFDFLRQEINFSEPFAFVEYWARGYTQDCLMRLVNHMNGTEKPLPFYYFRSIYSSDEQHVRHNFTAVNHPMAPVEAVFANMPYSTVRGYKRVGDRVEPDVAPQSFDGYLFQSLERSLVEFADKYANLRPIDPDRMDRDLAKFGFEYLLRHQSGRVFKEGLAPLHYSEAISGVEKEFAPELTWEALYGQLTGVPFNAQTKSLPISLARSKRSLVKMYRWRTALRPKSKRQQVKVILRKLFVEFCVRTVHFLNVINPVKSKNHQIAERVRVDQIPTSHDLHVPESISIDAQSADINDAPQIEPTRPDEAFSDLSPAVMTRRRLHAELLQNVQATQDDGLIAEESTPAILHLDQFARPGVETNSLIPDVSQNRGGMGFHEGSR